MFPPSEIYACSVYGGAHKRNTLGLILFRIVVRVQATLIQLLKDILKGNARKK